MNIEDIVRTQDDDEAALTKNVMAGSSEFAQRDMILYDDDEGFYVQKSQKYIPSLFKVIDELLVNCSDHAISCINKQTIQHKLNPNVAQRYVDNISVSMTNSGIISIYNDGYGIPVIKRNGVYLPISLYTEYRTGTNIDHDEYRIPGGTNGCGGKIVTTFSNMTIIECQDAENNFRCVVTTDTKGKKTVKDITVKPNTTGLQFTKIRFRINWENTKYKSYKPAVKDLFSRWIYNRCTLLSLFLNKYRPCKVTVGLSVAKQTFTSIPKNAYHEMMIPMKIKDKNNLGYNNVMFGNCDIYISVIKSGNPLKLSIINGVEITGNPALDQIMLKLYNAIKKQVFDTTKIEFKKGMFNRSIVTMFIGTIMNPQWVGQTKDSITMTDKIINMYSIDYVETAKVLAEIFSEHLIAKKAESVTKVNKKIKNDKYTPAFNIINKNKKATNYLWIAEGDSALTFVKTGLGLGQEKKTLRYNYNNSGILSTGGVIMNVYNKIKLQEMKDFKYVTDKKDKSILLLDKKCTENIFINTFIAALNIKPNCAYNTQAELAKLDYSEIIIATDQDKDGWNINGLLLVLFMKWPNLIKYGCIKRLQTPIVRLKPKNITKENYLKTKNFFTEDELYVFMQRNKIPTGYELKYYKGLGGTEELYVKGTFLNNIDQYIYTFQSSEKSVILLDTYYNKLNADLRKKELSTPLRKMTKVEIDLYKQKIMTISTFLQIYVKDYQIDNLHRKLLKVMDGQNNVTGKLLDCYQRVYAKKNETKVDELAGQVSKMTNYHHGVMSMEATITKQTQTFPGKKIYPLLEPLGISGDRFDGGKKYPSSRYLHVKLQKTIFEAIFREEDKILLQRLESENKTIEPLNYFPIVPLTILENYKTTAHGWQIQVWGRDFDQTIKAIVQLLNNKKLTGELPINKNMTKAEFIHAEDESGKQYLYSKGSYTINRLRDRDEIHVTELPLGVWNKTYIDDLTSESSYLIKDIIHTDFDIANRTYDDKVYIIIPLRHGWEKHILKKEDPLFTDIELAFKLQVRLCDELNFMSPDGCVVSFDSYIEFLIYWYNLRKDGYVKRVERRIEILKNLILFNTNKYNYLKNFHAWKLGERRPNSETHKIMATNGLLMLNKTYIAPDISIPTNKICIYIGITHEGQDADFDKISTKYATYEYLDSIRNDKVRAEHLDPLEKKIIEYKNELEMMSKPNVWKSIWYAEIKNLANIVREHH